MAHRNRKHIENMANSQEEPVCSGLIIPSFSQFNKKTADVKVTIHLPDDFVPIPSKKKQKRKNGIATPLGYCNSAEGPTVTYLLHGSKIRCMELFAEKLGLDDNKSKGKHWPKMIQCMVISKGDLTPEMFDKVVEWAYTGHYTAGLGLSRPRKPPVGERLDKKAAAAGLLLRCPELVEYAIQNLRARMDAASQHEVDAEHHAAFAIQKVKDREDERRKSKTKIRDVGKKLAAARIDD